MDMGPISRCSHPPRSSDVTSTCKGGGFHQPRAKQRERAPRRAWALRTPARPRRSSLGPAAEAREHPQCLSSWWHQGMLRGSCKHKGLATVPRVLAGIMSYRTQKRDRQITGDSQSNPAKVQGRCPQPCFIWGQGFWRYKLHVPCTSPSFLQGRKKDCSALTAGGGAGLNHREPPQGNLSSLRSKLRASREHDPWR